MKKLKALKKRKMSMLKKASKAAKKARKASKKTRKASKKTRKVRRTSRSSSRSAFGSSCGSLPTMAFGKRMAMPMEFGKHMAMPMEFGKRISFGGQYAGGAAEFGKRRRMVRKVSDRRTAPKVSKAKAMAAFKAFYRRHCSASSRVGSRFGNGGNPPLYQSMGYEFCPLGQGGVLGPNSTGLFPSPCTSLDRGARDTAMAGKLGGRTSGQDEALLTKAYGATNAAKMIAQNAGYKGPMSFGKRRRVVRRRVMTTAEKRKLLAKRRRMIKRRLEKCKRDAKRAMASSGVRRRRSVRSRSIVRRRSY